MKTKFIKLTALFLSLIMLISMIPVFATGDNYIGDNYNDNLYDDNLYDDKNFKPVSVGMDFSVEAKDEIQLKLELAQESDDLVFEVEAMREENVKHFHLEDGSFQAVTYGSAVHRKDADGKWQDIDNTLVLQNVKGTNRYSAPNSRVTFANAFSPSTNIMTLRENGYTVSWSILKNDKINNTENTPSSIAKITNRASKNSLLGVNSDAPKIDRLTKIDNTSSIIYENVFKNVDLEYILVSNDIKENIIVKSILDSYIFTFILEIENLIAKPNNNGAINLYDVKTGDIIYIIPAPYMYDADGETSHDVNYTFNDLGNSKYEITVTASEKWINDPNRTFPIVIDPVITYNNGVLDTFVNSASSSQNYGSAIEMWVSSSRTSLIRSTSLPTLPSGSTIQDAKLHAAFYYNVVNGNFIRVGAYKINKSWSESGATYNNFNPSSELNVSKDLLSSSDLYANGPISTNPGWATFTVTTAVKSWYNSGTPNNSINYGIALKHISVSGSNVSVIFKPREAGTQYRAYYTITYREAQLPSGVYRIRNVANSSMYMDTTGYTSGAAVTQRTTKPIGSTNQRDQLFKITYLTTSLPANNRYYSIRSMRNSALVLSAPTTGTTRNAKFVGDYYDDTGANGLWSQPNMAEITWKIETSLTNHNYVTIKNNGGTSSIGYLSTPSNTTAGASLITSSVVNNNSTWVLERYTGSEINGATRYTSPSTFKVGEKYTFSGFMYSSVPGRNGPIKWYVKNPDGTKTDKAKIDETTGVLTALKPGEVKIWYNYDGLTYYWVITVTICYIEDGVYALRKPNTTSYMNSSSTGGGTYVTQATYSLPPSSEATRAGMFKISYRAATNDYVIRNMANNEIIVYANPGYSTGYPLTLKQSGVSDAGMSTNYTWNITKSSDGYYYISYTTGGITYYMYMPSTGYLHLTTNINTNGTKWDLCKSYASFKNIVLGERSQIVNTGSTNLSALGTPTVFYSTTIDQNSAGSASYSVSSPSGTVSLATINSSGILNATKPGRVVVTVNFSSVGISKTIDMYINPTSGNYYLIQNNSTCGFLNGSVQDYTGDDAYNSYNFYELIPTSFDMTTGYFVQNVATGKYLTAPPNPNSTGITFENKLPEVDYGPFGMMPDPRQVWIISLDTSD